jgi:hypothetical protein
MAEDERWRHSPSGGYGDGEHSCDDSCSWELEAKAAMHACVEALWEETAFAAKLSSERASELRCWRNEMQLLAARSGKAQPQ